MYKMKDEPPWKRRVVVGRGGGGGGEEVRVEVCFAGCETLTKISFHFTELFKDKWTDLGSKFPKKIVVLRRWGFLFRFLSTELMI